MLESVIAFITNALSSYLNLHNAVVRKIEQPDRMLYRIAFAIISGFIAVVYLLKLLGVLPTPLPYAFLEFMLQLATAVPLIIGLVEFPRKPKSGG